MRKLGTILAIAIIPALGAPVMAQDDGTGFSTGQPADQAERPKPYLREQSGDWNVVCLPQAEGKERCQLHQIALRDDGNPVAEITIFPLPPGNPAVAGSEIVTPLGTMLTQQLRLEIDGGETKLYPFAYCLPKGCVSRPGFTAPELAQLEKGEVATMTLFSLADPKKPLTVTISLDGFAKGYDSLFD